MAAPDCVPVHRHLDDPIVELLGKEQDLDVTPKEYLKSTYTYPLFKKTTRRP